MAVASWRPDMAVQVAFNAWPNDPSTVLVWQDLSALFVAANQVGRGQQYELQQNLGGRPTLAFLDPNEYLNPTNTGSPYWPFVQVYRQLLWQGMWPNGGVGNLLNTGAEPPGPYDPTFDSYDTGSTPPWITPVAATPVVGTATPHSGSKDLTWPVLTSVTVQGVSWQVPCIPGRQYTSSAYVRQSSASTQQIAVTDQTLAADWFWGRTTTSGWGTPQYFGGVWTTSGGSAADYSAGDGAGVQALTTVNTLHNSFTDTGATDMQVRGVVFLDVDQATGAAVTTRFAARVTDVNNYYVASLSWNTDGTLSLALDKRVGGTGSVLTSTALAGTYTAGTQWSICLDVHGSRLQAKAWPTSTPEPDFQLSTTDTSLTTGTLAGFICRTETGNTNGTVNASLAQFSVVGTVAGTTTSTTGSYQRLSVSWTATQPLHTVQLATSGTAVGGTVLLDDVQHEPGSSASTFTTTGPVIYGVFRGNVERWPSEWVVDTQGFLGLCQTTCVDSFTPLNKITLSAEVRNSILAKQPTYYWTLGESAGAATFGESSGNNGPSLVKSDGKFGPSPTFEAGAALNLPGDPGGTGLSANTGGVAINIPESVAQTGTLDNTPTLTGLGASAPPWSVTVAFWLTHSPPTLSEESIINLFAGNQAMIFIEGQHGGTDRLVFNSAWPDNNAGVAVTDVWADGNPHLFVWITTVTATTGAVRLYADGTLVGSNINTATSAPQLFTGIQIGGLIFGSTLVPAEPALTGGVYAHVAVWNRELTTDEITDLYQAGQGYAGETTGERVARYLSYGWHGLTSIQTGQSVMGVSPLTAGTTTLAAIQQGPVTTEGGNFWPDSRGYTTFTARTQQYLETTSSYTFGEDVAGGEYPYQEGVVFGFDPQLLYDTATITNVPAGPNVTVTDPAAVQQFFPQSYPRTINVQDPNEVTDAANFFLSQYGQPRQRVASIVLNPVAYPPLWPVVLGVEIGMRVTVVRRPKAANQGAGFVMQQDYFVLNITHDNINMDPAEGQWQTVLLLAPVDLYQVGILDDATYGLLDVSFILAY